MNNGFHGFNDAFACSGDPPVVVFFSNGETWDPHSYLCHGTPVYGGLDGYSHYIWSSYPSGTPVVTEPHAIADIITPYSNSNVHAMTATIGIDATYTGPLQAGVYGMATNDLTPQGGGVAYAFFIDTLFFTHRLLLCKVNDGLDYSPDSGPGSNYTILGKKSSAGWSYFDFNTLTLAWYSDPIFLKGTYLRAIMNGITIWRIVHTGANAHISTDESLYAGRFGVMNSNNGIIYFGE